MSWPGNTFLAHLGAGVDLVRPHLRRVSLSPGQVLYEPGQLVRTVYFLEAGVVSKLALFEDGTEIECALIGREGAIGAMSALGLRTAITRDVCHMRAPALTVETARLAEAAGRCMSLRAALDRYCAFKMSHAIRNGACNARHPVEQRLCRWLLTCADVLESDDIRLPQDLFAKMLGAQRTSVNPILGRLREDGLIALARSRVTLLRRSQLAARSCECYAQLRQLEASMWPVTRARSAAAEYPPSAARMAPQGRRAAV